MKGPSEVGYHWKTSRDAAYRMRDTLAMHRAALGAMGTLEHKYWVAIRLSDGGSDNQLYDTRQDAMRGQLHPTLCCYLPIMPTIPEPTACDIILWYVRGAYDRGHRPDESTPHLHIPMALELTHAARNGPDRRN